LFVVEGKGVLPESALYTIVSFEIKEDGAIRAIISLKGNKANEVLVALLPSIEISCFSESLPDMNEIFVSLVNDTVHA
ncbi:MAG TPA: DUF4162 domain-containing protein, partial [Cytophagaceae bacterium]